jgi:hypothetical protein
VSYLLQSRAGLPGSGILKTISDQLPVTYNPDDAIAGMFRL